MAWPYDILASCIVGVSGDGVGACGGEVMCEVGAGAEDFVKCLCWLAVLIAEGAAILGDSRVVLSPTPSALDHL